MEFLLTSQVFIWYLSKVFATRDLWHNATQQWLSSLCLQQCYRYASLLPELSCFSFFYFLFFLDFLPRLLAAQVTLPKESLILKKYIFPLITDTPFPLLCYGEKKKRHLQWPRCYFCKKKKRKAFKQCFLRIQDIQSSIFSDTDAISPSDAATSLR